MELTCQDQFIHQIKPETFLYYAKLFVNGQKVTQFKANDSVISSANTSILTLGTLAKPYPSGANNRLSPKHINDTKMYGNIYGFSVDYSSISNEDILKIYICLMKKNGVV